MFERWLIDSKPPLQNRTAAERATRGDTYGDAICASRRRSTRSLAACT
jgi:hypothetical protein